jgi:antitoxin (DNA-binding transcriptional repressor) of toxin-antitoxin stability system
MKRVSLKELKQNLASWVELAHQGASVEVMKHNQPFAMLVPWNPNELIVGSQVGKVNLKPCLKNATGGKWLDILTEDRDT